MSRRPEVLLAAALVVATIAIAVFATGGPGPVRSSGTAPAPATVPAAPAPAAPAAEPEPAMIVVPDLVAAWYAVPETGAIGNEETNAEVRRQAEALGLRADVELCFSMAGHGGDRQDPPAGARVGEGTTVRLHIEVGGE